MASKFPDDLWQSHSLMAFCCLQGRQTRDVESLEEIPLLPGMSKTENMLRWGFIKKVYGIIACQLLLTAAVAAVIYLIQPVQNFVLGSMAFQITFAVLPLLGNILTNGTNLISPSTSFPQLCIRVSTEQAYWSLPMPLLIRNVQVCFRCTCTKEDTPTTCSS